MPKKPKPKKNKKAVEKKPKPERILPLIPKNVSKSDLSILEESFEGDSDMILFFLAWLKHHRNATKAYQELHPNVSPEVAAVLGSRKVSKLRKVNTEIIFESYGLGIDTYLEHLKQGLNATNVDTVKVVSEKEGPKGKKKVEISYEKVETPNYSVRSQYHEKLGKLLGLEGKQDGAPTVAVQVNNLISEKKNTYGI